jgi:hypothetical protein
VKSTFFILSCSSFRLCCLLEVMGCLVAFSVGRGAGYFRSALGWLRWLVCCAVKGVCMINMVRGVVMRVYYSLSIYSTLYATTLTFYTI